MTNRPRDPTGADEHIAALSAEQLLSELDAVADAGEAEAIIAARLNEPSTHSPPITIALAAQLQFLRSQRAFGEGALDDAVNRATEAERGFREVEMTNRAHLARALRLTASSLLEITKRNISLAVDLQTQADDALRDAGGLEDRYGPTVEHLRPLGLALLALRAKAHGDVDTAAGLLNETALALESIARRYYGDAPRVRGWAEFHRALAVSLQAEVAFGQFAFDRVSLFDVASAAHAVELFSADAEPGVSEATVVAAVLNDVLSALQEFSQVMLAAITSGPRQPAQLRTLRSSVAQARVNALRVGAIGSPIARSLETLLAQMENYERLTVAAGSDQDGQRQSLTQYHADLYASTVLVAFDYFHDIAGELAERGHGRSPLLIANEYDVQDVLYAMLKTSLPDLTREEWTPRRANSASRIDLISRAAGLVIETKFVRSANHAHRLSREIRDDIEPYAEHTDCRRECFFVYDPQHHLPNARQFQQELSGPRSLRNKEYEVTVIVRPS